MFKRALHYRFHLSQIERFHNVVKGPKPQSANRALDRLHAADHHNYRVGRHAFDLRNHVEAAHARHGDVADDELILGRQQAAQAPLQPSRPSCNSAGR